MEMGEGTEKKEWMAGERNRAVGLCSLAKIPVGVHGRWSLAINLRTALDM